MSGRPARKPWGARDFRALQEENARARRSDALAAALLGEDARTRGHSPTEDFVKWLLEVEKRYFQRGPQHGKS